MVPETIIWKDKKLFLLDQRVLPYETKYVTCESVEDTARSIENMTVRGAPAIGVAAAYGMVLSLGREDIDAAAERLAKTRPTAVNLFWAIKRMRDLYKANSALNEKELYALMESEAKKIREEDIAINRAMGRFGAELLPEKCTAITHCNAGALATAGYGTALGVFRAAAEAGKSVKVYADETRPRLQGGLLTSYELHRDGFDVTVITDSMAAFLMSREKIDVVVTGADRIAANGDTANKIGTYGLAVSAAHHKIPFYIAAPLSTFDADCASGADIPIEERSGAEVHSFGGNKVIPDEIKVWNPSFDVTPNKLIAGIITEYGVIRAPYAENIKRILESEGKNK